MKFSRRENYLPLFKLFTVFSRIIRLKYIPLHIVVQKFFHESKIKFFDLNLYYLQSNLFDKIVRNCFLKISFFFIMLQKATTIIPCTVVQKFFYESKIKFFDSN